MKVFEVLMMNGGFVEKMNFSGMNVIVVSEDDFFGKDLENLDVKEEIKEVDDVWEIEGFGEYRKSIEVGFLKYFDGDVVSVKKVMVFIEELYVEFNF